MQDLLPLCLAHGDTARVQELEEGLRLSFGFCCVFPPPELRVVFGSQGLDHRVVGHGGVQQSRHGQRFHQTGIFDLRVRRQRSPALALGRPLADPPLTLDQDREDPPHPPAVHGRRLLRRVPLALLRDDLEGEILQRAPPGLGIDASPEHTGVAGEIGINGVASQQVCRRFVARGHVGPQDVIQIALLAGMGLQGRHGYHPAAADDLVARDLRLDQMLVEWREGLTARQAQRGA